MAVYVVLTVITVVLAGFVSNQEYVQRNIAGTGVPECERQRLSNLFLVSVIGFFLILVSAGRVAVGNDYWVYRDNFLLIADHAHVSSEPGFNAVVRLLVWIFGYDNYIPVFAFFSVVTICFFMKALWDQSEWFVFSFFLFMTGGFYFSSMNSVRYYLVVAVCLYSMKYVLRKEYLKFTVIICIAALFHKSVLVVLPAYLLAHFLAERKIPKWVYGAGGTFIASLLLFRDFYRKIIFALYPYYEDSAFDHVNFSVVNILKCVAVVVLGIICYRCALKGNVRNRFYFFLNIGALVLYTFGSFIPEISRIGYYLIISQIFLIPNLLLRIENKKIKNLLVAGTVICYLVYFAFFLKKAPDDGIRLLPYFNWIIGQ